MNSNPFDRLSDQLVLRETAKAFVLADASEGRGIAGLAAIEQRKLYLPAAHSSLYSYCVSEMHMTEDEACKRIRVARLGLDYPCILGALTERKLTVSAVLVLAPVLNQQSACELVSAAEHLTRAQIQLMLAHRFPRPDIASEVKAIAPVESLPAPSHAPPQMTEGIKSTPELSAPGRINLTPPEHSAPASPQAGRPRVAPLAPERFAVQLTIDQATHDKLRYAQALLAHALPSGDLPQLLDRALDALIKVLEKQKFGAASTRAAALRSRVAPMERRATPSG